MKNSDFKELKEIEKTILKGVNVKDNFSKIKTISAFDIGYNNKNYNCVVVVLDFETLKEIEVKTISGEEIISYSPNLTAFREGPVIMQAYRSLENKPDVLIVKGNGIINPSKIELANYVGVMLNKPCIGVAKDLTTGRLDEDKIIFNHEVKGYAVRIKEFANPVYVTPGHNISIETSVDIIKKLSLGDYKLPLPLHLAHKYLNKIKRK